MKHILLTVITLVFCFQLHAQESRKDRIKSLKIAFLTEKLELQPEEAEKFWPIYNAHEEKLFQLKVEKLGRIRRDLAREGMETMSDKEAQTLLEEIRQTEGRICDEEKKFQKQLQGTLSAKKIIHLGILEEKFKRELFRKLRDKHNSGGKN